MCRSTSTAADAITATAAADEGDDRHLLKQHPLEQEVARSQQLKRPLTKWHSALCHRRTNVLLLPIAIVCAMLLILAVKLPFEANGGAAPAATAAVDVCSSPAAAFNLRDGSAMPCLASGTGGRTDAATDTRYTAVRLAIAAGVRHIDTAEIYLDEEVVGRAIREAAVARERVWLTTKLSPRTSLLLLILRSLRGPLTGLAVCWLALLTHNPVKDRLFRSRRVAAGEFNHTAFALDGVAKGGPSFAARLHAAPLRRGERAETLLALRGSLHRLGMSFVDHYMVHRPIAAQLVVQWRAMLEAC
jgi:hypothetical protein